MSREERINTHTVSQSTKRRLFICKRCHLLFMPFLFTKKRLTSQKNMVVYVHKCVRVNYVWSTSSSSDSFTYYCVWIASPSSSASSEGKILMFRIGSLALILCILLPFILCILTTHIIFIFIVKRSTYFYKNLRNFYTLLCVYNY